MDESSRDAANAALASLPTFADNDRACTRMVLIVQEFSYLSYAEKERLLFDRWYWRRQPVEAR